MCFSAPVSLATFIVESLISLYLWHRDRGYDRMNALFIFTFSLVQLWEGGIWLQGNSATVAVPLILLSLWLQPLVQCYGAYYVTGSWIFQGFILLYVLTFIYALYRATSETFTVITGPHNHLIWNSEAHPESFLSGGIRLFTWFYLFGLLFPLIYTQQWLLWGIGLFTLIYSFFTYGRSKEASSYWCYLGLAYALGALFS